MKHWVNEEPHIYMHTYGITLLDQIRISLASMPSTLHRSTRDKFITTTSKSIMWNAVTDSDLIIHSELSIQQWAIIHRAVRVRPYSKKIANHFNEKLLKSIFSNYLREVELCCTMVNEALLIHSDRSHYTMHIHRLWLNEYNAFEWKWCLLCAYVSVECDYYSVTCLLHVSL